MERTGVIFDCDGTLLDSMHMWHTFDDRLAERAGVTFTKADKDYMTAATLEECGRYMHERYGIGTSAANVMDMIHDEMLSFYQKEVTPKAGAPELVRALADANIPMAVASSTPSELLRVGLARTDLDAAMLAIVSVEDVSSSKREPKVYDTARAALGTERAATWGVEDALYAIRTLNSADYRTLAVFDSVTAGAPEDLQREADVFLESFASLPADQIVQIITHPAN
ncbi:MAG: HAD family phosphatase [Eggerthellaceae bacterium]|nr:HAD family phosphatase [Eggerthellaceae bacterium]